jgi:RNA polymerase sigma factor (sigma-70 family)
MSQLSTAVWSGTEESSQSMSVQVQQLSNYDLVLQCQTGHRPDKSAFSELMRRYQSHVDKVLYHLAPDWQDRADLAQEVWIRVYRNVSKLQEPVKFRGWLSRIATNLFYDELRKRKRNATPLSLDAPRAMDDGEMNWDIASDAPGPVEEMGSREFHEKLQMAIGELPEVFRTTIVLQEIEGLAYDRRFPWHREVSHCPCPTPAPRAASALFGSLDLTLRFALRFDALSFDTELALVKHPITSYHHVFLQRFQPRLQ